MKSIIISFFLLFNFVYGANKILNYEGRKLQEGNGNGIEIHENYVKTGFRLKQIGTLNEEYLKAITISGDKIYVGTGLSGKIYVFSDKKFKLFADSADSYVNIIRKFGNNLYAGTSPGGILFIFNGNSRKKVKTGEYSVNDIIKVGNKIFLSTSSNGKILSFDGKHIKLFHQFDATSVNRLILGKNGIYAFCSDPASVFLLDNNGGILHSYQFKENEIADISLKNGTIFVAVNSKNGMGNIKSAIYKLNSDFSSCMKLVEIGKSINSITLFNKYILFSAGNEGVLYAAETDSYTSTPIKIRETDNLMFSKMVNLNNKIYAISSHKGALYEIKPSSYGYYITKPIYFNSPVKIVDIEAIGIKNYDLYYRVGNSSFGDSVNARWNSYRSNTLAGEPQTLFLQLKVNLSANSRIYGFKIGYEKRSFPPAIDSVILSPPGVLYSDGFFSGYNKRAKRSKITRLKNTGFSVRNNAKEISNSKRSLIVYAKSEERPFYSISLKSLYLNKSYDVVKDDSSHFLVLNTERYPDGTYQLFISVKYENGKPVYGQTAPFLMDNSPPIVTKYRFSGNNLRISLSDTTGVYDVKYCVNGSKWESVYLKPDQIYKKKANVTIPLKRKPDFIIIKLTDIFGNIGYFTIKER